MNLPQFITRTCIWNCTNKDTWHTLQTTKLVDNNPIGYYRCMSCTDENAEGYHMITIDPRVYGKLKYTYGNDDTIIGIDDDGNPINLKDYSYSDIADLRVKTGDMPKDITGEVTVSEVKTQGISESSTLL